MELKKYKVYSKMRSVFSYSEFPVRLLKFKRSKWKNWKLNFYKNLKRELYKKVRERKKKKKYREFNILLDFSPSKVRSKFFDKFSRTYKSGLLIKNSLDQYFNGAISLKFFKNQVSAKKKVLNKLLVRPYYKLDILLWKLRFFSSAKQALHNIKNKQVVVNDKLTTKNFFLKKGDIIKVLNKKRGLIQNTVLKKSTLIPFCEVDYYTYNIVIIENSIDLDQKSLSLIFRDTIELPSFIDYIEKK